MGHLDSIMFSQTARRVATATRSRVGARSVSGGFKAESMSEMEDVLDRDVIRQFLKEGAPSSTAASLSTPSSPKTWGGGSTRSMGTSSSVAKEIAQMERESNFMQIREAARELTTILDVTRYARSYLPGQLVNTEDSIGFISDELMLPLLPNENFLATWGDAKLTYEERRKIMEKIHLLHGDE